MGRRGWVVAVASALVAVCAAPWSPCGPARAGDAKVAETLFKSGRQAFQKGDFAGALPFFRKAEEENPDLIEAVWWRAAAHEKAGDKPAALAAYRDFLGRFEAKAAGGTASKEEQRLRGLAEKAVDALAAGEKEFRKLEDAYVASLLQFAKEQFVRDPGVALKALAQLLAVRPDHDEALKLREKLGGAAAAEAAAEPKAPPAPGGAFAKVKEWRDLLAEKAFEATSIEYTATSMVVDTKTGLLIRNESPIDFGTSYAYEFEFRVTATHDRGWLTGLLFGSRKDLFYSAHAKSGRIELIRARGKEQGEDLAAFDMPPMDQEAWHRLGVVVGGAEVEVWFDGKKVAAWTDPSGEPLAGEVGIFQQRCRTERRLFRAGTFE